MRLPPARREAPSLFGEAHHLFGVVHSPVRRSAPSVRRERLSRTQCRNGCEIKKKCELVAAKRIENLIYTREVLRCNALGQQQLCHSVPGQQQFPDGALPQRPGQPLPDGAPLRRPGQQKLRYGSTPATTPLRRPCQQQTSSGGEKYSGLASNLAHLGRIC